VKTSLISITPDAQKIIGYCAKVSNPANQTGDPTGLLKYCIKNHHWSVFEMANMVVEIETSRAISAQILRHRSFSFQEFSQRYATATDFETYPARRQDLKNRQNSIDDMDETTKMRFEALQKEIQTISKTMYEDALTMGIAKEQARFLLPLSTQTRLYMNGTIRSWIHYINLRSANGTQKEHMDIALAIKDIFKEQLPAIAEALEW
jgi:thymidylate synthase (FAD)